MENGRLKMKVKTLNEKVAKLNDEEAEDDDGKIAPESELDYDDLNRGDFFLIGGIHGITSTFYAILVRKI